MEYWNCGEEDRVSEFALSSNSSQTSSNWHGINKTYEFCDELRASLEGELVDLGFVLFSCTWRHDLQIEILELTVNAKM